MGLKGDEIFPQKQTFFSVTSFFSHKTIKTKPLTFISMKNELNRWYLYVYILRCRTKADGEKGEKVVYIEEITEKKSSKTKEDKLRENYGRYS
jgi:hypothetical protein